VQIFFFTSLSFAVPESYNTLLKRYVDPHGDVDYQGWKSDPLFPVLKKELEQYPKPKHDDAYWINMYNALTIQVVCDHLPISSIRDIDAGKVWSHYQFSLSSGRYTLDQIEHEILRPRKDPRVHAALNCASKGCPPLWNAIYQQQHLDQQLDAAVQRWFARNAYKKSDKELRLSKIFHWYAEDFQPSPLNFLRTHRPQEDWSQISSWEFMEYDWSLNQKTNNEQGTR